MNLLEIAKQKIVKTINQVLGKDLVKEPDLVFPPDPKVGDLSLACFNLSKELKKTPNEIAQTLATHTKLSFVADIKNVGPYLNFTLDKTKLAEEMFKVIKKEKGKYGASQAGKKQKVMVEYSNGNTHKELHVGHLRNICYGDAVNRILAANGYQSIPVSYINDFGIHVAKTIWGYINSNKNISKSTGQNLGQIYATSAIKLESDEAGQKEVKDIMAMIESRKGKEFEIWKKTRKLSIKQFDEIYKQLSVKFRDTFYESEVIDEGRKMVRQLTKAGILTESQGAVIANLEKYKLGVLVFLRADGTALYPVADLALAVKKFKKYKLDESIYVVDVRQGQYFKQLFKVLEFMGYKQKMVHLGYEFLKLPSGMMSSRTGNVITFEELWDEVVRRATAETKKRHGGWSEKKIKTVAEKIAVGAMKFEMVKVGRGAVITFDIEKALRFEGFTAAYIQYSGARIQSILRKSEIRNSISETISKFKIQNSKLEHPKEHQLIMKLAKYPEAVKKAGAEYEPSEIAKYLFELAQEFNDYYHEVPVLKAEAETRVARLALIGAVSQTLANGLGLLGIETLEEM